MQHLGFLIYVTKLLHLVKGDLTALTRNSDLTLYEYSKSALTVCVSYRRPCKRCVITVLLPGSIEAEDKVLKERMSPVENGKPHDVNPLIC